MSKIKDKLKILFNRIFRKSSYPMLSNVSKENYDKYYRTYDTLAKIFEGLEDIDAFLVGGISAAIQTNTDLYRQNGDIDILCSEKDLPKLLQKLKEIGYRIEDKRGVKTGNVIDINGEFKVGSHDINTSIKDGNLLGIGLFVYKEKDGEIIFTSYAFDERIGKYVSRETVMSKELFDTIYSREVVDYKGIKLRTQSKEYVYMSKSKGMREKDKEDAAIIEPTLDEESMKRVEKIQLLEAKTKKYKIVFDKDGTVISREKIPSVEEKINAYLNSLLKKDSTKTPEQIVQEVLQSEGYGRHVTEHPELALLIKRWGKNQKDRRADDSIKKSEETSAIKRDDMGDFADSESP